MAPGNFLLFRVGVFSFAIVWPCGLIDDRNEIDQLQSVSLWNWLIFKAQAYNYFTVNMWAHDKYTNHVDTEFNLL